MGEEYKIIHRANVWINGFSKKDLAKFTKYEFEKYIDDMPHQDKNYVKLIDMKTYLDAESKEENWDNFFKTE